MYFTCINGHFKTCTSINTTYERTVPLAMRVEVCVRILLRAGDCADLQPMVGCFCASDLKNSFNEHFLTQKRKTRLFVLFLWWTYPQLQFLLKLFVSIKKSEKLYCRIEQCIINHPLKLVCKSFILYKLYSSNWSLNASLEDFMHQMFYMSKFKLVDVHSFLNVT